MYEKERFASLTTAIAALLAGLALFCRVCRRNWAVHSGTLSASPTVARPDLIAFTKHVDILHP